MRRSLSPGQKTFLEHIQSNPLFAKKVDIRHRQMRSCSPQQKLFSASDISTSLFLQPRVIHDKVLADMPMVQVTRQPQTLTKTQQVPQLQDSTQVNQLLNKFGFNRFKRPELGEIKMIQRVEQLSGVQILNYGNEQLQEFFEVRKQLETPKLELQKLQDYL